MKSRDERKRELERTSARQLYGILDKHQGTSTNLRARRKTPATAILVQQILEIEFPKPEEKAS
ncbi:MAG: hypothetical protein N2C12_10760 [Planctomycetales bacterium]